MCFIPRPCRGNTHEMAHFTVRRDCVHLRGRSRNRAASVVALGCSLLVQNVQDQMPLWAAKQELRWCHANAPVLKVGVRQCFGLVGADPIVPEPGFVMTQIAFSWCTDDLVTSLFEVGNSMTSPFTRLERARRCWCRSCGADFQKGLEKSGARSQPGT